MAQQLQSFLGSGDTLSRLRDHAERLRGLQALLTGMLPAPLNGACSVANLKGDTLVLIARNGATAARIKQTLPSLIDGFAVAGVQVTCIQVKVTVSGEPERVPTGPERILGDSGRQSIEALRDSLPEDAPLRASLVRLLDRSRQE